MAAENELELWEQRNMEFHEALIAGCTSSWLIRFYRILYDQHKRYRNISLKYGQKANKPRDLHAEHQRIYDAAIARDVETACRETEAHIRITAEVTREVLKQRLDQ